MKDGEEVILHLARQGSARALLVGMAKRGDFRVCVGFPSKSTYRSQRSGVQVPVMTFYRSGMLIGKRVPGLPIVQMINCWRGLNLECREKENRLHGNLGNIKIKCPFDVTLTQPQC